MKPLKLQETKLLCFDPKLRKYALMGRKLGDTFIKSVEEEHFMRVCNGYGIQYDAFSQFEKAGIENIRVFEIHTGATWKSTRKDWVEHGHVADYGRGKQIFLSMKYMAFESRMMKEKKQEQREKQVVEAEQKKLF